MMPSPLVSASLNVMSLYHDTLLAKIAQNDRKYKPLIPTSLHTRYTRAWSDKNYWYKWAARTLELLRFTQLVIEMGLRRKVSTKNKWRAIVLLEVLKYVFDEDRGLDLQFDIILGPSFGLFFCESRGGLSLLLRFRSATLIQLLSRFLPTHHPPLLLHPLPRLLLQQHPIISRTTMCLCHPIRSLHIHLLVLIPLWKISYFQKLLLLLLSDHQHHSSVHCHLPLTGYPKLPIY